MAPRGLSAEEKRKRLLQIFHDSKDIYQLRDLERLAPKLKGIVSQSVKDVLQSLVDDDMVICEKIGISNYYWSFPSQAAKARISRKNTLLNELKSLESRKRDLGLALESAQHGREEGAAREAALRELADEEAKNRRLKAELEVFKDCDPTVYTAQLASIKTCRDAVSRWTDNIYLIQKYCTENFNIDRLDFNRQFDIKEEDFDDF